MKNIVVLVTLLAFAFVAREASAEKVAKMDGDTLTILEQSVVTIVEKVPEGLSPESAMQLVNGEIAMTVIKGGLEDILFPLLFPLILKIVSTICLASV